jgi:hypothetical protein
MEGLFLVRNNYFYTRMSSFEENRVLALHPRSESCRIRLIIKYGTWGAGLPAERTLWMSTH